MNHELEPVPEHEGKPESESQATEAGATDERELHLRNLEAELEAARAEVAENLDKFMRAKAEMENVRRRAEADMAGTRRFAIERFATELLAVRDSLELARAVDLEGENKEALSKMHEGLDLTLKLLDTVFEKFALSVINPQGEKFDPQQHQAMGVAESGEVPPNHVVNVVQKGYSLHGRLLRPAMVIVAKAKSGENQAGAT